MLLDYFQNLENSHQIITDSGVKIITKLDLLKLVSIKQYLLSNLKGHSVGVCYKNQALLAQLLILLDGNVKDLLLLSSDTSLSLINNHMNLLGATILLTDKKINSPDLKSFDFFSLQTITDLSAIRDTNSTNWIIPTSGTTGIPKLVKHSFSNLTKALKIDQTKGKAYHWSCFYEISRFAGLQVLLQSFVAGSLFIVPALHLTIEKQIDRLIQLNCNALSATPTMWRKILMSPNAEGLELKQITLGGEIADQTILTALDRSYPPARIVHIYASTEAGVGFSVKDKKEGFPVSFVEDPDQKIKLKVIDNMLYIKSHKDHSVYIKSPHALVSDDSFIKTGDLVELRGDRYIFLGRDSGIINVGGNKVHPEEIEKEILAVDGVKFTKVVGKKNPILGEIIEAFIVLDRAIDDHDGFKKLIQRQCRKNLVSYKVPAILRIVNEMPVNSVGKMQRND